MSQQTTQEVPKAPSLITERVQNEVERAENVPTIELEAKAESKAAEALAQVKPSAKSVAVEPVEIIEDRQLHEQLGAAVARMSVGDAFAQGAAAQERLEYLSSFRNKEKGDMVDCQAAAKAEGRSESEIVDEFQKCSALVSQVNKVNAQKMRFDAYERNARVPLVGPRAVANDMSPHGYSSSPAGKTLFGLMEEVHGQKKDIDFGIRQNVRLKNMSLDDILNTSPIVTGGTITRTGQGAGTAAGIRVDKFRSTQEIVMAVPYRNFFSPLIPRMACPEGTNSFVWLSEPTVGIGSGTNEGSYVAPSNGYTYYGGTDSSVSAEVTTLKGNFTTADWNAITGATDALKVDTLNAYVNRTNGGGRVTAVGENQAFPQQSISIIENEITIKKRAVFATMTNEQANDVVMAKAYLNDVIARLLAEDLEDQLLNGNGMNGNTNVRGNMSGILANVGHTQDFGDNTSANSGGADTFADNAYLIKYLRSMRTFWSKRGADNAAGKAPSHLVLPYTAKVDMMSQRDTQGRFLWANTISGDYSSLFGIPLVLSDYLPENTGLLCNIGDCALVVKDGIQMEYGLNGEDFRADRASVRVKHRCEMLYKRQNSFHRLTNLENGIGNDANA